MRFTSNGVFSKDLFSLLIAHDSVQTLPIRYAQATLPSFYGSNTQI